MNQINFAPSHRSAVLISNKHCVGKHRSDPTTFLRDKSILISEGIHASSFYSQIHEKGWAIATGHVRGGAGGGGRGTSGCLSR